MKKLLFISIVLVTFLDAEVDLGDDLASGDLISAEVLNSKFNALNSVVGEIVDANLLGNWECISYMSSEGFVPDSYQIANGGNGQVGNGKFFSTNATLNLSETDNDTSIISPKSWTITKDDVVNSDGYLSGVYTLIGNTIFFHNDSTELQDEDELQDFKFLINRMSSSKLSLVESDNSRKIIVCELTSS
jgi:hypothetical protein